MKILILDAGLTLMRMLKLIKRSSFYALALCAYVAFLFPQGAMAGKRLSINPYPTSEAWSAQKPKKIERGQFKDVLAPVSHSEETFHQGAVESQGGVESQGSVKQGVLTPLSSDIQIYNDGAPINNGEPIPLIRKSNLNRWQAFRGADTRDVLETWAKESDVEFIWASDEGFEVLETLSIDTTFENAVRILLEQYDVHDLRPVASLHIDPNTRHRALVVQSDGG